MPGRAAAATAGRIRRSSSGSGNGRRLSTGSRNSRQKVSGASPSITIDSLDFAKPLFIDTEATKERVRLSLIKPVYNVFDHYHTEGRWQHVAKHAHFENVTLAVIGVNAIWLAIDTDWNQSETLSGAHPVFQVAEHLFCLYFFLEWLVRFMSFKYKRDGLKDGWFVFDSVLVLLMVAETWVLPTVVALAGVDGSSGGIGNNTSILRVFRLLRLTRMARMLRSMPELMILVKGMVSAMRSVFSVMALLGLIMYVFGIAFTELAANTEMGKDYFSNVGHSMYTLLLHGTFLDNLSIVSDEIKRDSIVCLVLFFVFVLLAALTVMNMLIGVLCEVVSAVASAEKEEVLVDLATEKLGSIIENLDSNNDMRISKGEFMCILENPDAAHALLEVGVDPIGLVDFADIIFGDTVADDLSFPEFMEMVLKFRGSNTATVKDIVDLRKSIFSELHGLHKHASQVQPAQRRLHQIPTWSSEDSSVRIPSVESLGALGLRDDNSNDGHPDQERRIDTRTIEWQLTELLSAVRNLPFSCETHVPSKADMDLSSQSWSHVLEARSEYQHQEDEVVEAKQEQRPQQRDAQQQCQHHEPQHLRSGFSHIPCRRQRVRSMPSPTSFSAICIESSGSARVPSVANVLSVAEGLSMGTDLPNVVKTLGTECPSLSFASTSADCEMGGDVGYNSSASFALETSSQVRSELARLGPDCMRRSACAGDVAGIGGAVAGSSKGSCYAGKGIARSAVAVADDHHGWH